MKRCDCVISWSTVSGVSFRAVTGGASARRCQAQAPLPVVRDQVQGEVEFVASSPSIPHAPVPHVPHPREGVFHGRRVASKWRYDVSLKSPSDFDGLGSAVRLGRGEEHRSRRTDFDGTSLRSVTTQSTRAGECLGPGCIECNVRHKARSRARTESGHCARRRRTATRPPSPSSATAPGAGTTSTVALKMRPLTPKPASRW